MSTRTRVALYDYGQEDVAEANELEAIMETYVLGAFTPKVWRLQSKGIVQVQGLVYRKSRQPITVFLVLVEMGNVANPIGAIVAVFDQLFNERKAPWLAFILPSNIVIFQQKPGTSKAFSGSIHDGTESLVPLDP